MPAPAPLDHRALYRLPWNLADNPIAWLEPTQQCNLSCDGCYRQNVKAHKSMDDVQADLDVFARLRNFDGVSIAGGDPLMHPELIEIVRRVTRMGRKAIINTNGLAMTKEKLRELRDAGLVGLTFHVDSKQGRPGWRDKTETQMCELRSTYAEMVASVGGLACAFNSTVYDDTLHEAPELVKWAERNMDIVHTMVFILFRAAACQEFDYYAGGRKVDVGQLVYGTAPETRRTNIDARELVNVLRERFPDFSPCAYLNGTVQPDSFKWLLSMRAGVPGKTYGWLGPKFMEATQSSYHLLTGRYMSYAPPWMLSVGRTVLLGASAFDAGARAAAAAWGRDVATWPLRARRPVHLQSVLVIQPIDTMDDGRDNMCDGCPDMTVHDGKLVWSCRLEEPRAFGSFVTAVPRSQNGGSTSKHLDVLRD
jgi:hypothetical protein